VPVETAAALALRFERHVQRLQGVRNSAGDAFALGALRRSDLDHIYESTFLDTVSYFEIYVEELFITCVLDKSGLVDVSPSIHVATRAHAGMLTSGSDRSHTSWSRMQEVMARAETLLQGGRPFSRLQNRRQDLAVLTSGLKVRNAIAHRSSSAREQFFKLPLSGLAPGRKTPAGYLQQLVGLSSRHETLLNTYARIAKALAAPRERAAVPFLQEESPYDSGQRGPCGEYACLKCGTAMRIPPRGGKLARCSTCSQPCITCGSRPTSHFQRVL